MSLHSRCKNSIDSTFHEEKVDFKTEQTKDDQVSYTLREFMTSKLNSAQKTSLLEQCILPVVITMMIIIYRGGIYAMNLCSEKIYQTKLRNYKQCRRHWAEWSHNNQVIKY